MAAFSPAVAPADYPASLPAISPASAPAFLPDCFAHFSPNDEPAFAPDCAAALIKIFCWVVLYSTIETKTVS